MGKELRKEVETDTLGSPSVPKKTVKEKVLAGTEEVEFDDPFGDD